MTRVLLNLDNFWQRDVLMNVFKGHSNEYEYTPDGIFRKIIPPPCPLCGSQMSHNGYNIYGKEGLGHIRIGRYLCSPCRCNCEEERFLEGDEGWLLFLYEWSIPASEIPSRLL